MQLCSVSFVSRMKIAYLLARLLCTVPPFDTALASLELSLVCVFTQMLLCFGGRR